MSDDLLLLAALRAQDYAEEMRANCPECEGDGDWAHCSACSPRFGSAIDMRAVALRSKRPILIEDAAPLDVDTLESIEEWALGFEQKINIGPVQSDVDEYVPSTAAATVELVRHVRARLHLQKGQP